MQNLSQLGLIAETRIENLNLQYQDDAVAVSEFPVGLIVGIGVALFVGLIVAKLICRSPAAANNPAGLLQEICKAHEVNSAGRCLLQKITTTAQIAQPAAVLLSVELFDSTIAEASRVNRLSQRDKATVAQLRSKLFAR